MVVAVLGRGEHDSFHAALDEFNSKGPQAADLGALLFFAGCHVAVAKKRPRWPIVDSAGRVDTDRRTPRDLVVRLDLKELEQRVVAPALGERARSPKQQLAAIRRLLKLRDRVPGADVAYINEAARWNVPPTEYGDPDLPDVRLVEECGEAIVTRVRTDAASTDLPQILQGHIDDAMSLDGDRRRSRLAALRLFFERGNDLLMACLAELNRNAFGEMTEAKARGCLPSVLAKALHSTVSLTQLLHERKPEFGRDLFFWAADPRTSGSWRLVSPRSVEIGERLLGRTWWSRLIRAVDAGDLAARDKEIDRLHRAVALVADHRLSHGLGDEDPEGPTQVDLDHPDVPADPRRSSDELVQSAQLADVIERIKKEAEIDPGGRDVRAALLFLEGRSIEEIGLALEVGKSQVYELKKRGLVRLQENPDLARLYDDLN